MKNLMMSALILISSIAMAQPGERKQRAMPNPEIQAKKMTLALDLSNKQEKQVLQVLEGQKSKIDDARLTKEERKELTADQREAVIVEKLEQRIALKREFKNILSDDQYERWEKMMAKRGKRNMEGMKKRKNKNR
jgi:hypothetical protein